MEGMIRKDTEDERKERQSVQMKTDVDWGALWRERGM